MKQRLYIRLPEAVLEPDTRLEWAIFSAAGAPGAGFSGAGTTETGTATLAEIGQRWGDAPSVEVLAIAPAADVLLTTTRIPSQQLRQVKQALPYMVEELIAEPIEKVHLAIPASLPGQGEDLPVAVISHERLIAWLDQLYSQRLRLVGLVPEILAAPWQPQTLSLVVDGDRILWRDGPFHGYQLAYGQWPQLLEWLAAQSWPQPQPLLRIYSASDESPAVAIADRLRQRLSLEVDRQTFSQPLWPTLAGQLQRDPERSINLLQGGYKVQRERSRSASGWRTAAGVAAAGVAIYAAVLFGTSHWFGSQAAQLRAETVQVYREIFPGAGRVVSARRQMAAQLGGGQEGLLSLLAGAGRLDPGLEIEQLRYSAGRGELQLELSAGSVDQLEGARRMLLDAGFQSELAGASETASGTRGRLLIRGD